MVAEAVQVFQSLVFSVAIAMPYAAPVAMITLVSKPSLHMAAMCTWHVYLGLYSITNATVVCEQFCTWAEYTVTSYRQLTFHALSAAAWYLFRPVLPSLGSEADQLMMS